MSRLAFVLCALVVAVQANHQYGGQRYGYGQKQKPIGYVGSYGSKAGSGKLVQGGGYGGGYGGHRGGIRGGYGGNVGHGGRGGVFGYRGYSRRPPQWMIEKWLKEWNKPFMGDLHQFKGKPKHFKIKTPKVTVYREPITVHKVQPIDVIQPVNVVKIPKVHQHKKVKVTESKPLYDQEITKTKVFEGAVDDLPKKPVDKVDLDLGGGPLGGGYGGDKLGGGLGKVDVGPLGGGLGLGGGKGGKGYDLDPGFSQPAPTSVVKDVKGSGFKDLPYGDKDGNIDPGFSRPSEFFEASKKAPKKVAGPY
eukprot:TRINITY_DN7728_c0_g1_i1.p1 TRINITY_DN7728_c0_g1~~TRINITY_DN7728_c0_g1_i1.p1  ORF type:complete len:305 (+),score=49.98 TRINITY_DN7728_c0_g1_i1:3-917(+)